MKLFKRKKRRRIVWTRNEYYSYYHEAIVLYEDSELIKVKNISHYMPIQWLLKENIIIHELEE